MTAADDLRIWVGRHVTLDLRYSDGEVERLELDVVTDKQADFSRGFLGESTPLAQAILGKTAGTDILYQAGDIAGVRVIAVLPELSAEPQDLSSRREALERKAASDSDRTSTVIYASSMNSKWGDYDPKYLEEEDDSSDKPQ